MQHLYSNVVYTSAGSPAKVFVQRVAFSSVVSDSLQMSFEPVSECLASLAYISHFLHSIRYTKHCVAVGLTACNVGAF